MEQGRRRTLSTSHNDRTSDGSAAISFDADRFSMNALPPRRAIRNSMKLPITDPITATIASHIALVGFAWRGISPARQPRLVSAARLHPEMRSMNSPVGPQATREQGILHLAQQLTKPSLVQDKYAEFLSPCPVSIRPPRRQPHSWSSCSPTRSPFRPQPRSVLSLLPDSTSGSVPVSTNVLPASGPPFASSHARTAGRPPAASHQLAIARLIEKPPDAVRDFRTHLFGSLQSVHVSVQR